MIRSGLERKIRRQGGGKQWYPQSLFAYNLFSMTKDALLRTYTKPMYSRRRLARGEFLFPHSSIPLLYNFSPAEPHEKSVPRRTIRETSAEVEDARAGTVSDEEREGLERPSSAAGD